MERISIRNKVRRIIKMAFRLIARLISRIIYITIRNSGIDRNAGKARILVYHRISNMPKEKWIELDNVLPNAFRQQMRCLKEGGYNVITLSDLCQLLDNRKPFPPRTVVLTFDDGYANNLYIVYPIMRDFGFLPTVFVVSDYVGANRPFEWLRWDTGSQLAREQCDMIWRPLDRGELAALAKEGAVIGSHGKTHSRQSTQNIRDFQSELRESRQALGEILGKPVDHFSYPFGLTKESRKASREFAECVQTAGYVSACTGLTGAVKPYSNRFVLNRISIYGQDHLIDFKAKVSGAYDWFGYLQRLLAFF
jgi:peptidoglycan/xylan/chitin deacetylase (PgdA/CDA1 family)